MKPRVYTDTSVLGGPFDAEWSTISQRFIAQVRQGHLIVVISDLTAAEVSLAPPNVQQLLASLAPPHRQDILVTPEALELAERYISERVIGSASRNDARHIATATVHRVDLLVSWNFKHIVNIERIRGYNSVNVRLGYPQLEIRTPAEILKYDPDEPEA